MSITSLTTDEVRQRVPMADAVDAVRRAFLHLAAGEFEMPVRTSLGDGTFLVMSTRHRPSRSIMVKTLSLNFDGRDPAILGTVTFGDLDSSRQVVADAGAVTGLRTGAVSGVATDLLAPAGASSCALIGAGAQGADQARAVHAVRALTTLRIVDLDATRAQALARQLRDEMPDTDISVWDDTDAALNGAEIVCCATTSTRPVLRTTSLHPRAHVNAIGAFKPTMHELPADLLASAHIVVDDLPAVIEESGEVIDALADGVITQGSLIELGPALGQDPPTTGRTVFKSVGVAIQDWAIAAALAEGHERQLAGTEH